MLAAIALALITPLTYAFPSETPSLFRTDAVFEGFLPVFGGLEGKAEIMLEVAVKSLQSDGPSRVEMDLSDASVMLQGAKMPFTVDDVRKFFPKTVVTYDPVGKMLGSDAPKVTLPIRLPGLDVQRFPELCFLPVEFSPGEVALGSVWNYRRTIDEVDTPFEARIDALSETEATILLKFSQDYTVLENEAKETVTDPKLAVTSVRTVVAGTGMAKFNIVKRQFSEAKFEVVADGVATDIASKETTNRKLKTLITTMLK